MGVLEKVRDHLKLVIRLRDVSNLNVSHLDQAS